MSSAKPWPAIPNAAWRPDFTSVPVSTIDRNGLSRYEALSCGVSGSKSTASEKTLPVRTQAAASIRFAGVIRFAVPSSSSSPQRPQFETRAISSETTGSLTPVPHRGAAVRPRTRTAACFARRARTARPRSGTRSTGGRCASSRPIVTAFSTTSSGRAPELGVTERLELGLLVVAELVVVDRAQAVVHRVLHARARAPVPGRGRRSRKSSVAVGGGSRPCAAVKSVVVPSNLLGDLVPRAQPDA